MTLIIGLTGGIGCGKSTVSAFFAQLNITVIDADLVARQVVSKDQPALALISKHFGEQIIINGELDRAGLREIIFQDESEKQWLNNLLHPLIRAEMLKQLNMASGAYVLLEAPLLFENKLDVLTDYDLVVDVNPTLQIERASSRDGVSVESIKAIMDSQIDPEQRLKQADFVIDNNNCSLEVLQRSVIDLDKQFRLLIK
ncbi:dephospho-CoA kinase [Psychromonas ossibalaenae]|uniref:dephospho-CoA kinase n=1 Tax=Psychromonas ossibalaenae TaxID=444922 RepID=UPI00036F8474|nr:dephospho-CoA kinase [Psychromonas ossibalaenae]